LYQEARLDYLVVRKYIIKIRSLNSNVLLHPQRKEINHIELEDRHTQSLALFLRAPIPCPIILTASHPPSPAIPLHREPLLAAALGQTGTVNHNLRDQSGYTID
jgi:hypothetical protein